MKRFPFTGLIVLGMITLYSCKEEAGPTLIITAIDEKGQAVDAALIKTHPCLDKNAPCETDRLDSNLIREKTANSAGQAVFEFTNSAVLDVQAIKDGDTGRTVVAIKTKEIKKSDKNEVSARVVIPQ